MYILTVISTRQVPKAFNPQFPISKKYFFQDKVYISQVLTIFINLTNMVNVKHIYKHSKLSEKCTNSYFFHPKLRIRL